MAANDGLVKIRIEVPDEEHGTTGECVWAKQIGDDLYEVRNSPWLTDEINFRDVVRAVPPDAESLPQYVEVVRRGGHRTIQVIFEDEAKENWDEVRTTLKGFGAGTEHAAGGLYAINLPPLLDFDAVADYLQECEDKGWLKHFYAPQPQPKGTEDIVH